MSEGGIYIQPGNYWLVVDACKGITTRKGDDCFVAEFGILKSTVEEQPPGSHVAWMAKLKFDAAPGNIKACLLGITEIAEADFDDDDAEDSIKEDNPLHGYFVSCEGTNIVTKAGNDFTKCTWHSLTEEQKKEAKQLARKFGW